MANDCLYIIHPDFIAYLGYDILSAVLVGSITRSPVDKSEGFEFTFRGKEQVLHLYNSGNVSMASVDEKFANLAQALTLWVRSSGDARYSRRAEGNVFNYAVCVRVTWTWISLPAALASLTLLMLGLTVATTTRRAVPVWKVFPLAMLLRGPAGDDWLDRDLLATTTGKASKASPHEDGSVDGMSGLASRVSVQLLKQDGKYRLRQVGVRSKKVKK